LKPKKVLLATVAAIGPWSPVINARVTCGFCRTTEGQMFYKCHRHNGNGYFITEISCENCAKAKTKAIHL
jgi:hypothetical protein